MAAGWSSQLLPARLTSGAGLQSENGAKHTHIYTLSHTVKQPETARRHTLTSITHSLAHTLFHRLKIAIHPVSRLLSSPLFAVLTVQHDLQTESCANM